MWRQPAAARGLGVAIGAGRRETAAVVGDDQFQMRRAGLEPHVGGLGACMPGDVGERFLGHAEHRQGAVAGQLREPRVGRADHAGAQPGARAECADPARQGADQAGIERGRGLVERAAVRIEGGVERLLGQRERAPAAFGRLLGQPGVEIGEGEAQAGEVGAEAVVQLAGEPAAGGFVGGGELGREFGGKGGQPGIRGRSNGRRRAGGCGGNHGEGNGGACRGGARLGQGAR